MEEVYTAGAVRIMAVVLAGAFLAACQSNPSTLTPTPTPSPIPTPPGATTVNVSGTWSGTGSDSFSPELVTWVLSQTGNAVSGTAELKAADPSDGTCGSCHKVKTGTLTGTLSGSTLTVSMKFPAGGDVPTPICVAELSASASVADRRITATYTGTDSCEGVYSNGAIELTRQP